MHVLTSFLSSKFLSIRHIYFLFHFFSSFIHGPVKKQKDCFMQSSLPAPYERTGGYKKTAEQVLLSRSHWLSSCLLSMWTRLVASHRLISLSCIQPAARRRQVQFKLLAPLYKSVYRLVKYNYQIICTIIYTGYAIAFTTLIMLLLQYESNQEEYHGKLAERRDLL